MKSKEEIIKYLLIYGYKESEIILILTNYKVAILKQATLLEIIKTTNIFLEEKGYTKQEIIKIATKFPQLYSYGKNNLEKKYNNLLDLGYTPKEIIKLTKDSANLYSYSTQNINTKIKDLIDLGYTKKDIIKITKSIPQIYGYNIKKIKEKIITLELIGYTKQEIIKMTKFHPQIYSYKKENILKRINEIISLNFTKEEVLNMTLKLPNLFGLKIETLEEKIKYLRKINLEKVIINDPKHLIQSVDLTYVRYEFLKDKNIEITMDNYRLLFLDEKEFIKRYDITKQELVNIYLNQKEKTKKLKKL